MRIAGLICVAALVLEAQQGRVAGPVSGIVFDGASRALLPVLGIPGAAVIGNPLALGYDVQSAWVSPRLDSAIAVAADGSLHALRLDSGAASERPVNGITVVPDTAVFSPSGTAAALYAGGMLQVVTGLPGAPLGAVTLSLETVAAAGKRPTPTTVPSFAVSDDGSLVLAAHGNSILLFDSGGNRRVLTDAAAGARVAFAPGGHDGAVADRANGVVLFHDLAGAAARQVVAASDDRLAHPSGLAFSPDGARLFVSSASAKSVVAFDLAAATNSVVTCDCSPAALVPMGAAFRLNEPGTGPLWLLDAAVPARIVFVPPRKND